MCAWLHSARHLSTGCAMLAVLALVFGAWPASAAGATVTEFPIPSFVREPFGIAAGSDGNLWFTEQTYNNIGRITPAGTLTEFAVPLTNFTGGSFESIAAGPDGNLWFAENAVSKIGRITPGGVVTEF